MNYSQHMADLAAQKLLDAGAPNYVGEVYTITVGEEDQFEVLVTTQKVGAMTPMQRFTQARQLLQDLVDCRVIEADTYFYEQAKEILK